MNWYKISIVIGSFSAYWWDGSKFIKVNNHADIFNDDRGWIPNVEERLEKGWIRITYVSGSERRLGLDCWERLSEQQARDIAFDFEKTTGNKVGRILFDWRKPKLGFESIQL